MNGVTRSKLPLGELLVSKGLITQDQLRIALLEQRRSGEPLGKLMVSQGFVSEGVLREALSENLGSQSIDLSRVIPAANALALLGKDVAKRLLVLPVALDHAISRLTVAMVNPNNLVALDQLRTLVKGLDIVPMLAGESDVLHAIDQYYGFELSIDGILREIETGEVDWSSLSATDNAYSQPVVRLIDALLADAVTRGASDIHFEPEQAFVRIRYRIDGVLRQIRALHRTYWPAMVVRLKVMATMNIAETRAPQDGRISLSLAGRPLDFRVSSQPTSWGENLVLRILDRQKGLVPLDRLGLEERNLNLLRLMIARPEGIILVTGPTGSGKTTTLYSILNHINTVEVNIMTLEDPVEYPIPQIRQTSVNEAARMDFANGIRSMMRQDPDIILVGEIRDRDTADMAFRAAMTGHQVYSTLHTSSALGALPRLLDIGVQADIMAGNIIGIIAQRLVRKLCVHCREAYAPDDFELRLLGEPAGWSGSIYRARGCAHCAETGYQGRTAIMELLRMNPELDEMVARRATMQEIRAVALRHGFRMLADDGCRRVLDGTTSLDEVSRVVDLTERIVL
ncbi:GspE/PulE family protein [Chitinilyticum piscinae]|uniref:Flp pilus assembly complex ATPase component TadA n=1 Tax=Chitinilyticum piscinae TaxID=2866724 RepID=A0A8J7FGL9_9NEIS|nr:GspE/PulE family protein [Chitinilyticum piscinae]MBE9607755.1 Flp pilus assembly complex ATPase component TadA [Chitinilyticum piscinae]